MLYNRPIICAIMYWLTHLHAKCAVLKGSGVWAVLASYLQAVALACGKADRFLNANWSFYIKCIKYLNPSWKI